MPGLENASAVEQAKALLALAQVDQKRTAAQRDMDIHAIAALTGQGAAAYATITRPTPDLDSALPLPDRLAGRSAGAPARHLGGAGAGDAAAEGPRSGACRFLSQHQSRGLCRLSGDRSFQFADRRIPSPMGAGPAIHLPIFDAGKIRAQYAGATAELDAAVADYNGAVLGAVRQTADAMTQVSSLASQRGEQQDALDSAHARPLPWPRRATRPAFPTRS